MRIRLEYNKAMPLLLALLLTAPPYPGKPFLGMYGDPVELPPANQYESTWGMNIQWVCAAGSAEAAGIKPGDTIVQFADRIWTDKKHVRFHKNVEDENRNPQPGDEITVAYLRDDELHNTTITLLPYPRTRAADSPAPLTYDPPDYAARLRTLIAEHDKQEDFDDLLHRLDLTQQFPDPQRLDLVRNLIRDPFMLEPAARDLVERSASANPLRAAAHALGVTPPELTHQLPQLENLDAHLDYIEQTLAEAAAANDRALANLTQDERDWIVAHRIDMLEAFRDVKMLSYDRDHQRQSNNVRLLDLLTKVDLTALFEQTAIAARLVNPAFLRSLRGNIDNPDAKTIASRNTPHGLILIAGTDRHRHARYCAALYDLGGDDVYANNIAASMPGKIPTAITVDFAGNDAYESTDHFNIACGDFGVGWLCDFEGDDSYVGRWFGQGAGFAGIGILFDERGDDHYRGLQYHQGVGHFGVGVLIDEDGDDRYDAHLASQGVGLPGGFGLLRDIDGDDHYYCKGEQPTGYGTPGVFEGWGQGFGAGYRVYASGGVGMLVDEDGRDVMEAGNFSQGGGYYYGFGVLYCGGDDDDQYIASRYGQGFGCHQAVGVMIERGGNDRYLTRNAVAQGLAWDEAGGLLLDENGDDLYEGGGFSHGASAHNGFAMFIDRNGDDTYRFTNQARAGGNTYHGGTSVSLFLDQGGDEDNYPSRKNNTTEHSGVNGFFVDE